MEIGRKIEAEMQTATDEQSSENLPARAAAGRNLIVIQLSRFRISGQRSVQWPGNHTEPNKLVAGESIYFTDYYQQLGRATRQMPSS